MNSKRQEIIGPGQRILLAGLLLCSALLQAAESGLQDHINEAISVYVDEIQNDGFEEVKVDIQPLDPRLRLADCSDQLQLEHRPRNRTVGRLTFKISCESPDSWTVHVPVTIQAFDNIVVSDLPIAKGTHLSSGDLRMELRDISRLHGGYFRSLDELDGFVAKRPIQAEQVMTPALVDPAKMINRGEKVVIIAEGPGLSIRATGFAMEDGAFGELVRVKNTSTNKVVEGRITEPGVVKVSL